MIKQPKLSRGPRNLKAGGFTNGLWRLEDRARLIALRADRDKAAANGDHAEALILNDRINSFKSSFQSEATKEYWARMDRRFGRRI